MAGIIIATDGSKHGTRAAEYGISLAKRMGEKVLAVYVINMKSLEMYAISHHDDISGYERENMGLIKEGENILEQVASKCRESGVDFSTRVLRGYPAEEIINLAGEENVEMIVVGSLGKTGLEHLLLGSVSEEVVKKSPCPVLVVRNG